MQARNLLLFVAFTLVILWGWFKLENIISPPRKDEAKKTDPEKDKDDEQKKAEKPGFWETRAKELNEVRRDFERAQRDREAAEKRAVTQRITPDSELLDLGEADPASPFHLHIRLDPRGAAVRSVLLNKFLASDFMGKPTKDRLELVPDAFNRREASYYLMHVPVGDPNESPFEKLAIVQWKADAVKSIKLDDGRERQVVTFRTTVQVPRVEGDKDKVVRMVNVHLAKTYTLTQGEYHLGLEVEMRTDETEPARTMFKYQLAGAHALPVEGKWYTNTFRNALIGVEKGNSLLRDIQDLRQISLWGGGKPIGKEKEHFIRYAAVAVQYFASVIVVDDEQREQAYLAKARPTLESFVLKGRFMGEKDFNSFVMEGDDVDPETKKKERTIHFLAVDDQAYEESVKASSVRAALAGVPKGTRMGVVVAIDPTGQLVALRVVTEANAHALWQDDITVRVTTEQIELRPGVPVVHKYLLYNGPVKPYLLDLPGKDTGVKAELVNRYIDKLHLNTLTDYHSPGWLGSFSSSIYWTDIIIKCTNFMHWVLAQINRVIPNYGLCILCLTILVRGLMFPISRKQALTSIKMQALAPELKKLQEKHKGDRQALGAATMQLYRENGVNPFGTCWFLLLQMPVFMGLYFCLQESIYFRLAGAWPTWIENLAAPDMMISWSEKIPFISDRDNYGGWFYLGPFFNLLPVIAVTLMIFQQKMMTPPPQDEQQEMQQKVMKYMMVFFGLLFYKVAAGLCLYFIASSVWGFAERRLLPKKKLATAVAAGAAVSVPVPAPSTGITTAPDGKGRSRKQGRGKKQEAIVPAEQATSAWGRLRRRVGAWWEEMQKRADKK
jgi:YidC/Oxa1 family membrane protein insertase